MNIYKNIVILTGAGISAESGLATFRAANGLWNNHRVEDVATVEGFAKNPEYVHDFYNELKKNYTKHSLIRLIRPLQNYRMSIRLI